MERGPCGRGRPLLGIQASAAAAVVVVVVQNSAIVGDRDRDRWAALGTAHTIRTRPRRPARTPMPLSSTCGDVAGMGSMKRFIIVDINKPKKASSRSGRCWHASSPPPAAAARTRLLRARLPSQEPPLPPLRRARWGHAGPAFEPTINSSGLRNSPTHLTGGAIHRPGTVREPFSSNTLLLFAGRLSLAAA